MWVCCLGLKFGQKKHGKQTTRQALKNFKKAGRLLKMSSYHEPVMKHEIIKNLEKKKNAVYIDATLGMGGHTHAIMESDIKPKKMFCIDLDEESLSKAKEN